MAARFNRRSALALLALVGIAFGRGGEPAANVIDTSDALVVGAHHVSRYLAAKYFGRFFESACLREGHAPSPGEIAAWWRGYIAKHIVIACAQDAGFRQNPEVSEAVRGMEEQVLTQASGPYYRVLCDAHPDLREMVEKTAALCGSSEMHCIVERFSDPMAEPRLLGSGFRSYGRLTQDRLLIRCIGDSGVDRLDANLRWPFRPVPELQETIATTPLGVWTRADLPLGVYYVMVLSRRTQAKLPGPEPREIAAALSEMVFERHHLEVIQDLGFTLSDAGARALLAICLQVPRFQLRFPASLLSGLRATTLYRCTAGPAVRTVTIGDYCDRFNRSVIRELPRDWNAMRRSAEDMAVAESDLAAARSLGIDRTAQFREDRKGYADLVALALFEKQRWGHAVDNLDARTKMKRLEEEEMQLALQLKDRYRVVEHIDYSKYGLPGQGTRPIWGS